MNHLEGHHRSYVDYNDSYAYGKLQQLASTIALLILGYYVLSLLDVWPDTSKRTLYEASIRLTPSSFIHALQYVMMRFGRLPEQDSVFKRESYGNFHAKEEALQRMFSNTPIPHVIQRARTLSGYNKFLPASKELGPPGLGNWDNSCYQNSILQGLASLPAFQHYIHRSLLLCEKTRVLSSTTDALVALLDQLSDTSSQRPTLWTPKVLKSMDSWQQQDAQEYFSRVMDAVEKEATKYTKILTRSADLGLTCLPTDESQSENTKEKQVRRIVQTLIGNPMDGMFAQALTCQTCGFSEGVSLTQFNCLTVNLGLGGSRSLEYLLDEYTAPELIEGVECDNCTHLARQKASPDDENVAEQKMNSADGEKVKKELRVKAKQITFGRLPKDLVIHVNRSIWDDYGNQIKNPSFVQFPLHLDFSGHWCAPLDAESENVQAVYELKCIVTHSGRHDNGHYVAYGRREKDWYCFNDEIVTRLNEEQVLSRGNVFMMFYEAIDRYPTSEDEDCDAAGEVVSGGVASPTSSSAESEVFEDPEVNSAHLSIPSLRTAGGGVQPSLSEGVLSHSIVPAV